MEIIWSHVIEGCTCKGNKCTKCDKVKCYGAFGQRSNRPKGITSACKECKSTKQRDYYSKNSEKLRAWALNYAQTHKEQKKTYQASWYRANTKHVSEKGKERRQKNGEEIRKKDRARYQANIEEKRTYDRQRSTRKTENHRQWTRRNPEHVAEHYRRKQAVRRTLKTRAGGSYTIAEWQALKAKYNYTCLRCGKQEPEIKLTADHIIPVIKGGSSNIDNIQPLCFSCNSRKHTDIIDYRKEVA